jgi:V8-like Glu-specific endopeptidase
MRPHVIAITCQTPDAAESLDATRPRADAKCCTQKGWQHMLDANATTARCAVLLVVSAFGCSAAADAEAEAGPPAGTAFGVSPETFELRGRKFLRRDLWSQEDYERVVYEGRARQPARDAKTLAAQLRGHSVRQGAYYIELEPNLALAEHILAGTSPRGTAPQTPREPRWVVGSDERTHVTSTTTTYPFTTMAFFEMGCTGTKIGARTMYTAAHCVYSTQNPTFTDGWICNDNVVRANCVSGATLLWPRFRFGVEDGNGFSGWTAQACHLQTVPNAFISLTDPNNGTEEDWYDFARWDYAVIDLTSCTASSTGWLGTFAADDTTIAGATGYVYGYPARANCPSNSDGAIGTTTNGVNVTGTSCPGTGSWPGSTYRYNADTSSPFSGAELWGMSSTDVNPGSSQAASTIRTTLDLTKGDSGSALYYFKATDDRRALGVFSNADSSENRFSRFTQETFDFFETYSDFPNDTL